MTLKRPHGKMVTLRVDESAKDFENLKEGDSTHARHTEAIAIPVEKQYKRFRVRRFKGLAVE